MFAKRKSSEGFEWHKYVRTTIKHRREQRRQKMRDAGHAAGQQVGAAGAALAVGSKAAGRAAWDGARAGAGALGLALQGLWHIILVVGTLAIDKAGVALLHAGRGIARLSQPVIEVLARPNIGIWVALGAAVAAGSGISRYRSAGLDREAAITLGLATLLVLASLPLLSRATGLRFPRLPSFRVAPRVAGAVGAIVVAGLVVFGLTRHGLMSLKGVTASLPLIGGAQPLQGRVLAIGGDSLRLGNTVLRLSGIEVPEPGQLCGKSGGRQFRCGALAQLGLARILNSGPVRCTLDGSDSAGQSLARCMQGDKEVNALMVRQGHAFAETGLILTRYAAEEKEARNAKAGIWAAGDSERPSEYRAKMWEEAKRRSPEGCPIKGVVTAGAKIYLLPWSADYERGRITKARGERWFCSEREALNAGWKAAARS